MSEQRTVIADLDQAGVLDGVRWAYHSATTRTRETYSEDDGHDAAWLGTTRFTLFRNRLDRVFACEQYAVHAPNGHAELDVLFAQLTERDIATMPQVDNDLVGRSNLNGSPGWSYGQYRFLLASCAFGKLDELPWPQKSPTKQRVAEQRNPEPPPSLFDGLTPEEVGGLEALTAVACLDLTTYVVAHSLDPLGQRIELALGRARLSSGGGQAWHWRENLLAMPPTDRVRRTENPPGPAGPSTVPDAPVRLRRQSNQQVEGRGSGQP